MANSEESHKVQNYILDRTLGRGTFGKVKLGYHTICKEHVAVKILQKNKIEKNEDAIRVQREISILKKVNHENIIKLYEILESDENLYLVMEYAKGGELFDYIVKKHQLSEPTAAHLFIQLINAVEYLHQQKIAHRDLKPENLLLDESRNIKVADFGLSNLYKNNECLKTACGSPCYAPPEMLHGNPYLGEKSDIWSCGIILYVMLCGFLPFENDNTKKLYEMIKYEEYDQPKNVSFFAQDLLKKLLVKDPYNRIGFDGIKQHQFYKSVVVQINQVITNYDTLTLKMLLELGYDVNSIYDQVKEQKHNSQTTLFWLLKIKASHQYSNYLCQRRQILQYNRQNKQSYKNKLQQTVQNKSIIQIQNQTARSNSKNKLSLSVQQRYPISNNKLHLKELEKFTNALTGIHVNLNKIKNCSKRIPDSLIDQVRQKTYSVQDRKYHNKTPDLSDFVIKKSQVKNNLFNLRKKSTTQQIEKLNFFNDKLNPQIKRGRNRTVNEKKKHILMEKYSNNYTPMLSRQSSPLTKLLALTRNQLQGIRNQNHLDKYNMMLSDL
ncbi:unnamed protein product (macronuclear) [Paramecium tetraurelia]|uniref:non-specific serine/threonine protein kinase n=1 Tax=Paramecium tetraurelia TaxID=5888 RepID=A0D2F7_PARTE|nr:uncharacterized protein GSPATT00012732001 [Paramecium tetraurelia]CAK77224.1 unnamed protein product [Paramecium tetraurelia]|eukprot:XP_001444621.1 hypothetical protein (macronuclear) [Paramecium tetraurelia strain d4-2]